MCKIICSTGALLGRPNNRNYRLLETLAPQLNCDGFEFMMYSTWYEEVDTLINTIKSLKLQIPVMHCEKHIGEAISQGDFAEAYHRFQINCDIAKELGAESMVVHLWDGITSDAHFPNNMEAYRHLREIADAKHINIFIENVVCNHEDPMKHWCELREHFPDIRFVFDTKMAAFHNQMDLLYEEQFQWLWKENHICHYHVNDYAGGYMEWDKLRTLPIGQGRVDFGRFFAFIQEIGYRGTFTVEATAFDQSGVVDIDMLNRQFTILRNAVSHGLF